MSTRPVVLHLLDDATPGGVTRVLEQIQTCPRLGQRGWSYCASSSADADALLATTAAEVLRRLAKCGCGRAQGAA